MSNRGEYSTVSDIRATYLDVESVTEDSLVLDLLRGVCKEIDSAAHQHFYPLIETRYFDYGVAARGRSLIVDKPLLAVTTLTNGDTNTISSSDYVFMPRNTNDTPKWGLFLLLSSGLSWQFGNDMENAISLAGTWGYHQDYANAYVSVGTISSSAGIDADDTSYEASDGHGIKAGMLLKCGTELMYATSVGGNTIGIERGVNGSTAATHALAAAVTAWTVDPALAQLARVATCMRYRERSHPGTDTFTLVSGETIVVPKDIGAWIGLEVARLGLERTAVG